MHAGLSRMTLGDGPTIKLVKLNQLVGSGLNFVFCLVIWGSVGGFSVLRYFSGVV